MGGAISIRPVGNTGRFAVDWSQGGALTPNDLNLKKNLLAGRFVIQRVLLWKQFSIRAEAPSQCCTPEFGMKPRSCSVCVWVRMGEDLFTLEV